MDVLQLLKQKQFKFEKAYGQNFITDKNLLKSIVADSGITNNDHCIEIGTGAGTLTKELCKVANFVTTIEIDESLKEIHQHMFSNVQYSVDDNANFMLSKDNNTPNLRCDSSNQNNPINTNSIHSSTTLYSHEPSSNNQIIHNLRIVYGDFLKIDKINLHNNLSYKVVANIPYYITTPIIFDLLQTSNPPQSMTLMVQKEVALRITAKPNTAEYGVLATICQLLTDTKINRFVPSTVFTPRPKVDSAIITLHLKSTTYHQNLPIIKLIHTAFGMRRKTLVNNILSKYPLSRSQIEQSINQIGLDSKVRGEVLTIEQYKQLAQILVDRHPPHTQATL